ncbi:DsbA family oxidoreductase [Isoptericola cucumis]|uniref:DsbA family oxidoreductase n=1 Tax=Isoptericola cucumis TaxID=1776856 RepID=UPI0032085472
MNMETTTSAASTTRLAIDVWVDVLCPWCYVGEHRLAEAIRQSDHSDQVDLRVHTFQLDPDAPTTVSSNLEYLSAKYAITAAQARAMERSMASQAAREGLDYEPDRPVRNTFDLLRLIHLGNEHGVGFEYLRAMQARVFTGEADAFEVATLVRLGADLGIPEDEIVDVLASDRYAEEVQADHRVAEELGARGLPFTVVGNRVGIPGTISTEQFRTIIDENWESTHD